jgi:hypothetical protein
MVCFQATVIKWKTAMVHWTTLVVLTVLGFGCGGRVGKDEGGTGGQSDQAGGGSASTSTSTPLGDCVLGVELAEAENCPWIVEGRCYEEREEACACACPRDRASVVCSSDFPAGDDGQVLVGCD